MHIAGLKVSVHDMMHEMFANVAPALFAWSIFAAPLTPQSAPALGKVVEVPEPCPIGPLADTTCRRFK
jgi:hypothetical protein